jgi:hypothetical protein
MNRKAVSRSTLCFLLAFYTHIYHGSLEDEYGASMKEQGASKGRKGSFRIGRPSWARYNTKAKSLFEGQESTSKASRTYSRVHFVPFLGCTATWSRGTLKQL